jgi:hypothetical protein
LSLLFHSFCFWMKRETFFSCSFLFITRERILLKS